MKKLLENKYVLIGLTLVIGALIGWLVKPSSNSGSASHEGEGHELTMNEKGVWTCSMHPQIRQNEPGSCPICGMDLIPVKEDGGDENPMAISMSANAMKLANVATQKVGMSSSTKTIRLTGKVQADERLIFTQSSHIPGRVENLMVNFTGELVKKGQTIARVYSPTLVTAQQELFEAQKIMDSQPELFQAAQKKLLNWKLTITQIDQILANGTPIETLPIISERSGYVTEKMVNQGDYIKQGAVLYKITDLSMVWILFDVYESDLQWMKKGDEISFTISSLPSETFNGKISYIDPIIDPKSRVAKVRLEMNNSRSQLKPEMFARGILEAGVQSNESLTVPKSAVMWTGTRSVVYVKNATDMGTSFMMQEVKLGATLGDRFVIKEGLESGQEIAVSGTFSIDAAAQLAGKPSMMSPEGGTAMTGHNHDGISGGETMKMEEEPTMKYPEINVSEETFEVNDTFKNQIKQVYFDYLPVKDAMIASAPAVANTKSEILLKAIAKVDMSQAKGEAHMEWMKDLNVLQTIAEMVKNEKNLENQRNLLSPLSDQLYHTLKKYQVETNGYRQFCPMAMNNKGAFWLSDSDKVLNPYFGDAMLTCGNVEEELN
jgi:membrane fusion protein, copper/silver efflux system